MTNGTARAAKLILLIDGENLPAKFAEPLIGRAHELGTVADIRVYGHFDNQKMNGWIGAIERLDLTKVNVPQTSARKNSADFKLVVEAMDMLHTRRLDGFCIASSDGDFATLAERIRASALSLYLFGEKKAPKGYRDLAHTFFDVTDLGAAKKAPAQPAPVRSTPVAARPASARTKPGVPKVATPRAQPKGKSTGRATRAKAIAAKPTVPKPDSVQPLAKERPPTEKVLAAIDKAAGADGWAHSQKVGNAITAADRGFEIKRYASNMKTLLSTAPGVELKKVGTETYVRRKP